MRKKAIEKIPFGKEKIHRLDDCFMIDGKLIDRKTNNINVRICLRENEFANYVEGAGWNKKRLNNWVSNNVFRASFELSTKERKELAEFYEKTNKKEYIKSTLNKVDKLIVLSESWKEFYSTLMNSEKIEVIYNSMDIPENIQKFIGSEFRMCKSLKKAFIYNDNIDYYNNGFDTNVFEGCDSIVLYGNEGSTTQTYAQQKRNRV